MAEPFLGEIKIVSFGFAPQGWALCNGQLLPINQNQALFALFGTMYGGNGQTNFALPDLRGRVPLHFGNNFTQGERAGEASHTLTVSELPAHTHGVRVTNQMQNSLVPTNNTIANGSPSEFYSGTQGATLNPVATSNVGGNQAHQNMQPFLVLNFIVALQGIFPSQN